MNKKKNPDYCINTVNISIAVPEKLKEQLQQEATERCLTLSRHVRTILECYVKKVHEMREE